MLRGNIGILGVSVGVDVGGRFRVDKDGDSLVEAKLKLDLEKQIDVYIVYLYGNLCAEAEGAYYFDIDQIELELYLRGGIKGGIVVSGDHFNIIAFHLDAMGALTAASPYKSWQLACSTRVSYHLNLYLFKVEGSVEAKFDTTIG